MYDDASQMLTVDIIIFLHSPHHTHNFLCFVNHVMLLKARLSAHINVKPISVEDMDACTSMVREGCSAYNALDSLITSGC